MATFMRRAMDFLGFEQDDEELEGYDRYDGYDDDEEEMASTFPARQALKRRVEPPTYDDQAYVSSTVRTISPRPVKPPKAQIPARQPERERPVITELKQSEKLVKKDEVTRSKRPFVVAPVKYGDAQQIGDHLRAEEPVIVNLQVVDRDLARRMIDFCSGLTYALSGSMEKVADQVFLLTPSNVEVSQEERERIQRNGLFR